MTKKNLCLLWGILYILCAGLGFIPGFVADVPAGLQGVLTFLSLACFFPPAALVYLARKEEDRDMLRRVRNLAALSLGATAVVLIASFALSMAPDWVGVFLHVVLILVSSPMVCSGYWALSLFLWACLLMASLSALRKMK